MVQNDLVTRDMETIFGSAPRWPVAPLRRGALARLVHGRGGVVAVALAGAAALLGLVAMPFLPGTTTIIEPVAVERDDAPILPPAPVAVLPPAPPAPVEARRSPVIRTRPQTVVRAVRPAPPRIVAVAAPATASPRLTGAALRRALAADVLLTRQLNAEAVATGRPPPVRVVVTP